MFEMKKSQTTILQEGIVKPCLPFCLPAGHILVLDSFVIWSFSKENYFLQRSWSLQQQDFINSFFILGMAVFNSLKSILGHCFLLGREEMLTSNHSTGAGWKCNSLYL